MKRKVSYDAAQELARELVHDKAVDPSITPHKFPSGEKKYQVSFHVWIDAEEEVTETEFPTAVGE